MEYLNHAINIKYQMSLCDIFKKLGLVWGGLIGIPVVSFLKVRLSLNLGLFSHHINMVFFIGI